MFNDLLNTHFNPLPSCEGRRQIPMRYPRIYNLFQSTPLMRGETGRAVSGAPRIIISIHSPHARGDFFTRYARKEEGYFNPLPSCEGRPGLAGQFGRIEDISIHSPHARGDQEKETVAQMIMNFNPLPSCEGRRRTEHPVF